MAIKRYSNGAGLSIGEARNPISRLGQAHPLGARRHNLNHNPRIPRVHSVERNEVTHFIPRRLIILANVII